MKTKLSTLIYSLVALFAASSCTDDRIWSSNDIIGDGEATISATIGFKSFDSALDSRTPGDELDGINNVTILAYNENGDKLIDRRMYSGDALNIENNNTTAPGNAVNPDNTVPTQKAKIEDFSLPYGKYQVYVVANADLTNEDVETVDKLKGITFKWDSNNIGKNDQMFGWFSTDNDAASAATLKDAHVITINKPNLTLTAWLVRLASKVTVNYDASGLAENVYIFLKSVQVKDIAESCALGVSNTPTSADQLIADGEKIVYYDGDEPSKDAFREGIYPATLTKSVESFDPTVHMHSSQKALFFYENNQGEGKDKRQDAVDNNTTSQTPGGDFNPGSGSSDGNIDFPDGNSNAENTGFKDEKRYGTYIEVKAYYRSNNPDRLGEGDITYRFMLGKDVKKDYNAERNYHYKLTLKFNRFANDVDWHIEYEPDPEIYTPNPYYISYIYNKTMDLPVQITGKIKEGSKVTARIIENDWMPYNYEANPPSYGSANQYYNQDNNELNPRVTKAQWDNTQHLWNGFLSLRKTVDVNIGSDVEAVDANTKNQKYWEDNNRGIRDYVTTIGSYNEADGAYKVEPSPDVNDATVFTIPLYTRAKNLVKTSGYTGNNPYVSYQRQAKIEFKASIFEPKENKYVEKTCTTTVIQVRRVVNPKGVWRDWNETNNFLVHLTRLTTEFTENPWAPEAANRSFESFTSNGPWSAEVIAEGGYDTETKTTFDATGWIKLSAADRATSQNNKVQGETGSEVKFNYSPNGTTKSSKKVRYGIIKVRYHNYTCEHLVFVRQGYAPIPVITGGKRWYSFNMNSKTEMTSSPCDEGSLFRKVNWDDPISSLNNKEISFQVDPKDGLMIYGKNEKKQWSEITCYPNGNYVDNPPNVEGENMMVARAEDYAALLKDNNVNFGFGILYDGKADGVQLPLKDAYSWYSDYQTGANGKGCGMRGCFVYNEQTGAQIFLPIGAAGYGRRRGFNQNSYPGTYHAGMLAYSNRNTYIDASTAQNLPLLFDLYRRPGAVYWVRTKENNILPGFSDATGWDFNYITFDFNPIQKSNIVSGTETDALRIRCVVDE